MTIAETVRTHLKEAMRAKDELRLSVVRGVLTAFTNEAVAKGGKPTDPLDDAAATAVLKRLAKQRKDAAEQFMAGGRPELAEKELKELTLLETYLPRMASRDEVRAAAQAVLAENTIDKAKIGIAIGLIMKKLGGNADGALVKEILAELIK